MFARFRPSRFVMMFVASGLAVPALADTELRWAASYGEAGSEEYRDTAAGPDGTVFVTGMNGLGAAGDIVTVAFDADGSQRWVASFDGPAGSQDVAQAIAVDAFGDVLVVGRSTTLTSSSDYVTIKYRGSDGTHLWTRYHDGDGSIDDGRDVAVDAAGSVFVTGTVWTSNDGTDIETVKYDANGSEQWVSRYTGPGSPPFADDHGVALAVDADGNVFVTGSSAASIDDYITIKYHGSDGRPLWQQRYDGIGLRDSPRAITVDAGGDVYVTGISYQTAEMFATIRYRGADGVQIWAAIDNPGVHDTVWSIIVEGDGVFIAASSDPDGDESNNNDDAYAARYDRATGAKEWDMRHGETGHGDYDVAHALVHDGANDLYLAGRTNSFGADSDILLLRVDASTGTVHERIAWSGPAAGGFDTALTAAPLPAGGVILGGIVTTAAGDRDYVALNFGGALEGDVDGDGTVGLSDLIAVLSNWGPCFICPADLNGDGTVGFADLALVLANWTA